MSWDGSVYYIDNGSSVDLEFIYTDPQSEDEVSVIVPRNQAKVVPNYGFRGTVTAVVSGAGMLDVKMTKHKDLDALMETINAG